MIVVKTFLFIVLGFLGALPFILTGGISEESANKALRAQGFTDIKITSYQFFDCSEDDFYHTGFTTKNIYGDLVEGTVCSGIFFKNSTIRF